MLRTFAKERPTSRRLPDLALDAEDASSAIARLDARLSLSPLAEAWQVRACAKAAVSLASVDGHPVREADVVAMMSGAPLPVQSSYLPTGRALGWWSEAMGRVPLSDVTERLVGRSTTRSRAAYEAQVEMDGEDALTPAARRALAAAGPMPRDARGDRIHRETLEAMRAEGRGLLAVARGLKESLSRVRDGGRAERAWELARRLAEEAAGRGDDAFAEAAASMAMVGPSILGEAHLAVADRLVETGATSGRLSILTGATKRIALERRGDPRAASGFLHELAREAREGLALLDALEETVAAWARDPRLAWDARSHLPDVLWAFLVLPAADATWISAALGLSLRVVQKFVKRLADDGLVVHWAERRTEGLEIRSAEVRLWMAAGFDRSLDRTVRRRHAWRRPELGADRVFADVMDRARDVDVSVPMAEVFARFDAEMVDVDREFGRFWSERRRVASR